MATQRSLPSVPSKHADFLSYVESHPNTPVADLLQPYKEYDEVLRQVFAQEPSHPSLSDNTLNILPLYRDEKPTHVKVRARDLDRESEEVKQRYIMPLNEEARKPSGAPAIVPTLKEFQTNFNLFCESSLVDLDWNNVVAAGSSVVTSLLPVPEEYRDSKRGLRQYYHEVLAPASDVDLFLYGLTEEEAVEKIKQIETSIKDSILHETTTIRTKNAITIASQYPTRHIQIVLRIYKSVAEILTGFDVDCSCAAYDGKQVYAAPRALAAYITQTNHIDLTRRSPSYESRLSKYSHRGFEVYWPQLDRSRIDPTIFERSFGRTVGLARLLILEKLPKSTDRDDYLDQRRAERGRPAINRYIGKSRVLKGNIKNDWDDEVAEWVEQDDVSDYHTFTIPYGIRFHAKKIEKLLYTKDLLLNAEWNKPKDRAVHLHRHPAFFGNAEDVIHDCCGYCPKPQTPEEEEVAAEEGKIYVSGDISFIKDDPGRQAIGSFNPITETDWTEMAYVGNTTRLCQAIVDNDLEHVQDWLSQEGSDPNRRDYTGRTPLQLACMVSSPEIVQCLVDSGARLISRVADGRTALHLAAQRGSREIVRILLTRSEQNEEEEAKKEELRKEARATEKQELKQTEEIREEKDDENEDEDMDDFEEVSEGDGEDGLSTTTGSFVKVKHGEKETVTDSIPEDANIDEPDVYDINVIAWDSHASPLHLAILNGHVEVVEELVSSFGADVMLPVKLLNEWDKKPRGAILTLVLALQLPIEKAKAMATKLIELGASCAQADMDQRSALHYSAMSKKPEVLEVFLNQDKTAVQRSINHLAVAGYTWRPTVQSALMSAIAAQDTISALKLLEAGAETSVSMESFDKSWQLKFGNEVSYRTIDQTTLHDHVNQPIFLAVSMEQPVIAMELLKRGVDPNSYDKYSAKVLKDANARHHTKGRTVLDHVQDKIRSLRLYKRENPVGDPPLEMEDDDFYLKDFKPGSWQHWHAATNLKRERQLHDGKKKAFEKRAETEKEKTGVQEKFEAVQGLLKEYEQLEADLLSRGGKTFKEMHPDIPDPQERPPFHYQPPKEEPYRVAFDFRVPNITDTTKEGYTQLFEAAWTGDLATIKSLTLSMWGPGKDQVPLRVSASVGGAKYSPYGELTPFTISVLRGHMDVAKAILEIVQAQYTPKEPPTGYTRYNMTQRDGYESDEHEDATDVGDDFVIYSDIIDDQFTVENIGEVATQVKCHTKPIDVLRGTCPAYDFLDDKSAEDQVVNRPKPTFGMPSLFGTSSLPEPAFDFKRRPNNLIQYAAWKEDLKLLKFLMDQSIQYLSREKEESARNFTISDGDFKYALRNGRTRSLAEMIRVTGVGIPLDELAKNSGVEVQEKPKYYQGLSIHGQKRADWAAAGRGMQLEAPAERHPPLLEAAYRGSLESVEWFLSTAPLRYYCEYAGNHQDDKRLQRLAQVDGGFERSMSNWLNTRSDLVLHCAIMSTPTAESQRLVEYLIKHAPNSMEAKSQNGYTPLLLAYYLRRTGFAKMLIDAGADQTAREASGCNLIHLALFNAANHVHSNPEEIKSLLEMIDPRLVPSMLVERSSSDPGSLTPLARWMHSTCTSTARRYSRWSNNPENKADLDQEHENKIKMFGMFMDFSRPFGQQQLEVLNAAGNTPLHDAVRFQLPTMLGMMLEQRPDLLHRESATGQTPAEEAMDSWIAEKTANPPKVPDLHDDQYNSMRSSRRETIQLDPEVFVKGRKQSSERTQIWELCQERMARENASEGVAQKRKLVSLYEANEVAKRLAAGNQKPKPKSRFRRIRARRMMRGAEWEEDELKDEVELWMKHSGELGY